MASVSSTCSHSDGCCAATIGTVRAMTIGKLKVSTSAHAILLAGARALRPRTRSSTAAATAIINSSHTVPGTLPSCSDASVSAPKATNSPCGMKMMRVTENTSTRARATKA